MLQEDRDLAALGLSDEEIGQAVTVNIGPEQSTTRLVSAGERKDFELALFEIAGKGFGRFTFEFGDLSTAGILGNGNDLGFVARFEIVRPIRADGREGEIIFRSKLAVDALKTKTERIFVLPIDEQQIAAAIAIDIDDLDGFDGAGERLR